MRLTRGLGNAGCTGRVVNGNNARSGFTGVRVLTWVSELIHSASLKHVNGDLRR